MASSPVMERIALQIRSEAAAINGFLGLLRAEQRLLVDGDLDALGAIVQKKDESLANLLNFAQQRKAMLAALASGHQPESGDGPAFGPGPQGDRLRREWSRLVTLSAEAAEINRLNGQIINQRRQKCDEALAILTASASRQAVYGPDGSSGRATFSRSIAAV
jgi:flagellar biosynthesis/type III secretory pathway chaperone